MKISRMMPLVMKKPWTTPRQKATKKTNKTDNHIMNCYSCFMPIPTQRGLPARRGRLIIDMPRSMIKLQTTLQLQLLRMVMIQVLVMSCKTRHLQMKTTMWRKLMLMELMGTRRMVGI